MLKEYIRKILPFRFRHFVWTLKPEIFRINTLVLANIGMSEKLVKIPDKYSLHIANSGDIERLKRFYEYSGPTAYDRKVPKRLNSDNCRGFAFVDNNTGEIIYNNWIILEYRQYLREYKIETEGPLVFWDSAVCLPEHRHQGLHMRMEQELINFSVAYGAKDFYMQIHSSNKKGNDYALSRGYRLLSTQYAISWPAFDVYRNLLAFLKNPFKKIII